MDGNDFPKMGINTTDLLTKCEALIKEAFDSRADDWGAVNWGDIGVCDVEYRLSMMDKNAQPRCVVVIEEASPDCRLAQWMTERLNLEGVYVEAEW